MVPKSWELYSLDELALVERGKFSARPRNDPKYYGGNIPFVQTGDVTSAGTFLSAYTQTLNQDGLKVSKLFPKDTILITIAANIGDTAIATFDVACPDSVVAIQPYRDKANVFWLKMMLETFKVELDAKASQNAQKNINLQVLKPLLVRTPPLPEQHKIAEVLSTWHRAIETVEKMIENSCSQKQALMQQLLTGKNRLPGFSKPWRVVRFNKVFERVSRKNSVANDNVLTISGQQGLVSQGEYFNKNVASDNLSGYTLLKKGDFAYNKSYSKGYPMGAIKPLDRYDQGVVSSLYICFRLRDNKPASQAFFRHYFEAGVFNREIYAFAQEGARNHGLLNVSVTDFFNAKLYIPEPDEKEAIEKVLSIAEQELNNLEAQLESLRNQKKALMQQLLTGKRRVKVSAPEAVTA